MTKPRRIALLIVAAHWLVAMWHLFLAANVLPAPNNHVSQLAVVLITSGHILVSIALWLLTDRPVGLVSVMFFVAALCADLYEHFLHASANNVFIVAPGHWTFWFDASVFMLLALEILGCLSGIRLIGDKAKNQRSLTGKGSNLSDQNRFRRTVTIVEPKPLISLTRVFRHD